MRVVKNATEKRVLEWLREIYGEEAVVHQYYANWCRNPSSGRMLPFDIFIPHLNLIIEVDGPQHFNTIKRKWGSAKSIRERDVLKMQKCIDVGVSLIRVPQEEAALKSGTIWKGELMSRVSWLNVFKYTAWPMVVGVSRTPTLYDKHMKELAELSKKNASSS